MSLENRYMYELIIPILLAITTTFYYKSLMNKEDTTRKGSLSLVTSILYMVGIGVCTALYEEHFFISSLPDAFLFSICLIGLGQLSSEVFGKTARLGVFTVFPLFMGSLLLPLLPHEAWNFDNPFFSLHILASMSAYSFFFIATILAFMQTLLWNKLKKKEFDKVFQILPNFEKVEKYSFLWVCFGIFTGGLGGVLGVQWWIEEQVSEHFPYLGFVIILPFILTATGKLSGLLNGIHFSRAIFISIGLLIGIHLVGLH